MILKGEIRNCRQMEVYGYVEGDVAAQSLLVHQGGRCFGTVKTDQAEIHGTVQGDVVVKHLINIRSSGSVTGNVQYGQLAMEVGANLSAEVRNVPPAIAGDLDLTVVKGRSVPVTLEDLNAVDPDDDAKDLIFAVSRATNGFITLSGAPGQAGRQVYPGRPAGRPGALQARRHRHEDGELRRGGGRPCRRYLRRTSDREGARQGALGQIPVFLQVSAWQRRWGAPRGSAPAER